MNNIALLLADGFEDVEALGTVDFLRRCGFNLTTVSIKNEKVTSARNIVVLADILFDKFDFSDISAIILPGGGLGAINLKNHNGVIKTVKHFFDEGKLVAAICAAPIVFDKAGILHGKKYTMYPGMEKDMQTGSYQNSPVIEDGNIITGYGPGATFKFAAKIAAYLGSGNEAEKVTKDMLIF